MIDTWVGATGNGLVDGGLRFEGAQVAEIQPRAGVGIDRDDAERAGRRRAPHRQRRPRHLRHRPDPARDRRRRGRRPRHAPPRRLLASPVQIVTGTTTLTLRAGGAEPGAAHPDRRLPTRAPRRSRRAAHRARARARHGRDAAQGRRRSPSPGRASRWSPRSTASPSASTASPSQIARGSHHVTATLRHHRTGAQHRVGAEAATSPSWSSSYTTQHPCCQPRVTNIHLAADTINGTIVEPGQTFSLNGALGPRTTEKGYKLAPGIGANLEFEDSVGGGVSQLSTTLFNAVFFGCYEDVTHTVHALYISRYPMGREATLNYPSIDNKFRNDSHSGVLIRTSYSGTSVTVSLYGNKEGRSCRAEGPNILADDPDPARVRRRPVAAGRHAEEARRRAHRATSSRTSASSAGRAARRPPALRRAVLDGQGQDRPRDRRRAHHHDGARGTATGRAATRGLTHEPIDPAGLHEALTFP